MLYTENMSFLLYLLIVLRTVKMVFFEKSAQWKHHKFCFKFLYLFSLLSFQQCTSKGGAACRDWRRGDIFGLSLNVIVGPWGFEGPRVRGSKWTAKRINPQMTRMNADWKRPFMAIVYFGICENLHRLRIYCCFVYTQVYKIQLGWPCKKPFSWHSGLDLESIEFKRRCNSGCRVVSGMTGIKTMLFWAATQPRRRKSCRF